ncbi:piggyBac transposable element-derived protein 4-like [Eurosta solidaginis]|uniref:piggyBac transposable element-derived protein 4-like n=1 Tax=Eurosta solidaginis TaxID=178769 RepID=UPI00353126D8
MADGKWFTPRQLSALSYEEQQAYIRQTLEESQEEISDHDSVVGDEALDECVGDIGGDDSDLEEPTLPEYDPEDGSDSDEELEDAPTETGEYFTARDGNVWSYIQPQPVRFRTHNILRSAQSGPVRATQGLTISETFKLITSDEICDIIIRESNRKARQFFDDDNAKHPTREPRSWIPITESEFDAYLGVLLLSGVTHSGYVHTKDLWNTKSHPLYRAAMSLRRFWEISRFIRFDNGNTCQQRKQTDKAAAISDVFLMLNNCLRRYYVAGANVTVDEQLYAYRGGTGFTQYIPSKPAKYGIKVWWVCDSISFYPLQGQIYTGMAQSGERERNVGERIVKDLSINLFDGSGRNIVCDNFFTSYNLAKSLMIDNNLSILGTCNKRRTFVPAAFANPKGREAESSMFGFYNHVTMCSYVPKKNKAVVLLSTSHYTTETSGPKKKPLLILDYNKTKGGVDSMDMCLSEYSTKRRTNRRRF